MLKFKSAQTPDGKPGRELACGLKVFSVLIFCYLLDQAKSSSLRGNERTRISYLTRIFLRAIAKNLRQSCLSFIFLWYRCAKRHFSFGRQKKSNQKKTLGCVLIL